MAPAEAVDLQSTPLIDAHRRLGARLAPFGGWLMPISYTTILDEHQAVRERCGLFDISHMGQIEVRGADALAWLERLVTRRLAGLQVGQASYGLLCHEGGGIIDDLVVYRVASERVLVIANASRIERDLAHLAHWRDRLAPQAQVINHSSQRGAIAIQGPRAIDVMRRVTDAPVDRLKRYAGLEATIHGIPTWVARTGYTGEDGCEVFASAAAIGQLWERLLAQGHPAGIQPCGLGARDTLRLEAGYLLYGQDMDEQRTPLEAGLERWIEWEGHEFVGQAALRCQRERGVAERLIGFRVVDRAIARHGYPVMAGARQVGVVTSGTFAPSLKQSVGLGYVASDVLTRSQPLAVAIHGAPHEMQVVPRPFYHRSRA